ncbi:MAG: Dabb family protein [Methanothrix sp.]|nr:Dabb family protein [Methanothrix sp.]
MIKHIVMFKLKESADGSDRAENIQRLKETLEALPEKIGEIRSFEVGVNFSETSTAYDLVLSSIFECKEDLYSYQRHPEHMKVVDLVGRICENRVVADYEV